MFHHAKKRLLPDALRPGIAVLYMIMYVNRIVLKNRINV